MGFKTIKEDRAESVGYVSGSDAERILNGIEISVSDRGYPLVHEEEEDAHSYYDKTYKIIITVEPA